QSLPQKNMIINDDDALATGARLHKCRFCPTETLLSILYASSRGGSTSPKRMLKISRNGLGAGRLQIGRLQVGADARPRRKILNALNPATIRNKNNNIEATRAGTPRPGICLTPTARY